MGRPEQVRFVHLAAGLKLIFPTADTRDLLSKREIHLGLADLPFGFTHSVTSTARAMRAGLLSKVMGLE